MTQHLPPSVSSVHSPSFRRLAWGLLAASWACALVSLVLSMARWAAIGHETGWGGWMPLSVVPSQALLVGLTPPPSMETHWRWVGVALERMTSFALPQEQAASAVRSHNGTIL